MTERKMLFITIYSQLGVTIMQPSHLFHPWGETMWISTCLWTNYEEKQLPKSSANKKGAEK